MNVTFVGININDVKNYFWKLIFAVRDLIDVGEFCVYKFSW